MNISRTICLLVISQLSGITAGYTAPIEPPALGVYQDTIESRHDEALLGKRFMVQVRKYMTLVTDPVSNDYLQNVGQRLAKHAGATYEHCHFFIVNDRRINAFAGPDCHIGINSGLMVATTTESELAAVMAHELAHVSRQHLRRATEKSGQVNLETAAALIAATAIGVTAKDNSGGNMAGAAIVSALAGGTQQMLNSSRQYELEADRNSIKILAQAGFDPNAVPNFLAKMQHLDYDYNHEVPSSLLTHPVSTERIADAENHISTPQHKSVVTKNVSLYDLIKARLNVLLFQNTSQAVIYYKKLLKSAKSPGSIADRYGYVIALLQNRQFVSAKTQVLALIAPNSQEILYQLALAQAEVGLGNPQQALKILQRNQLKFVGYTPLVQQYAEILISTGQFNLAKEFLEQQIQPYLVSARPVAKLASGEAKEQVGFQNGSIVTLYNLLADTYSKLQQLPAAYQAKANAAVAEGDARRARILLEKALQLPKLTSSERAKIKLALLQVKD